jgi:hypothetical protein
MGLVTPLARTPAEHALFVRAEVGPPAPGGFVDEDGEPIPVTYCPWLGARPAVAERLRILASLAFEDALRPLDRAANGRASVPVAVLVVSSAPRTGLSEADRDALEAALAPAAVDRTALQLTGEAGFFEGLVLAESLLESGEVRAVAVVAADSLVAPATIAEHRRLGSTPWDADLPRSAEGAAAVLLTTSAFAREKELDVLATVRHAATRRGQAGDDDDEMVDGAAMTVLLRGLPGACWPLGASFGQHGVGALRQREWDIAAARCAGTFEESCALVSLESAIGSLGAASGAASFVHGIAVHRLGAWPVEDTPRAEAPFLAWAISREGVRGIAAATMGEGSHAASCLRPRPLRLQAALREDDPADLSMSTTPAIDPRDQELGGFGVALGGSRGEADAVAIDPERADPVPIGDHYASVMADCLARMAMLARHRDERPLREREGIEARLQAQVDAIVEARASVADMLAFWNDEAEDDPSVTWAVVFTLGSIEGRTSLGGTRELVHAFPEDADLHALLAADALSAAPHPDRAELADDLLRSAHPLARAVAVELQSRLGLLGMEAALGVLDDAHPAPKAAALRALARLPELDAALPRVRACLGLDDPSVAWEAARALTLAGQRDAYLDVRDGGPLAARLGSKAVEILVLDGALDDVATMQRLVRRVPLSAEVLSAVARFGHPAAWAFLVHGLDRPELADDAHRALVTLFGPLVTGEHEHDPAAWREALRRTEIPEGTRWRRGQPWSAQVVLAECASGELSRREIELRQDELRARTGRPASADLAVWGSAATSS